MFRNKQIFLTLAIFFFAGALIFAGGPKRRQPINPSIPPKPYADGEVLVKFKSGLDLTAVDNFAAAQSLKVKKRFKFMSMSIGQQIVLLKSTQKVDAEVLAKALSANPNVEYATPNYRRDLCATPNDTYYSSLWGMPKIQAPQAWDISTGSSSVIVAVIDTGFDYLHPDLAANAWKNPGEIAGNGIDDDGNGYTDDVYGIDPAGTDGSVPDTDPMDGYGHGSHCAGSIGAVGNNSRGVVGVNWKVRIMGLKFFDDAGEGGYDADSIECIQYAVYQKTHGQNVVAINASWGSVGGTDSGALRNAIEFANNAGITFCAAAGNGGTDGIGDNNDRAGGANHHYPSDYTLPGIIAVAATDSNDALGTFSNYGATSIDLGAPGVAILSTIPPIYVPGAGSDIFFDNMSVQGNWTHGAISGTDYWQITTDQEGFSNPDFPIPSPPSFWSDRPGANYAENSNTWLRYNANIDLSGYVGQKIYFSMGSAMAFATGDHGYVEFSNNGGSTWTVIHDFTDEGWYWSSWPLLIPDSFKTTQFRMRFRLQSDADGATWIGWLIDNVGIGLANTYYDSWNGTSMATPHVAGAVAYLASIYPNETVAQRKSRILYGGDDIASLHTTTYSGNRLNLYGAYAYTPAAQPSITVTSPNGGEVWMIGSIHNITWNWTGTFTSVELHYSLNSGASWTAIDTNDPNDGTFSWTIPTVTPSANCLVRVRERSNDNPSDTSDAVFSIAINTTETVSTPTAPSGPSTGMEGVSYTFSTGGSTSSSGHTLQYRFDWDDGTFSSWLPVGTLSASHVWTAASIHNVRAQARCSTHFFQSAWSAAHPISLDDTPTWAAISRFDVCASESQPTVEWHTASEMGPVGFNLWRRDARTGQYEPVNPALLPALPNAPQGGVYRFADPGAFSGEPVVYRLEEVDALGRVMSYGPFTVTFGASSWDSADGPEVRLGREEPGEAYGYRRFAREQSLYEQERLRERQRERRQGLSVRDGTKGGERARITVKGKGLFYVSAAQAADGLGMSEAGAAALIGGYGLKLTGLGKEIAWLADANGAGLFFYNDGAETIYCDKNVYFLEKGRGRAMETAGGGSAGAADPNQTYGEALHFEGNRYALLIPAMDPAGDLWFWDYVVAGGAAKSFAIEVPGVASGKATLKASLQGATDTAAENDHHAVVSINGKQVGEAIWDGTQAHEFEVEFDASLLQEGANAIEVGGALDMGAPYSTFYVEAFDLSYQRYYKAVDNALICRGDSNSTITVSGLTEPQAVVLDVSNPVRPKQLAGVVPDLGGRVTFVPAGGTIAYLVSGLNAALRPVSVIGDKAAELRGPSHSAEYIVIAPEEFKATAQQLADFRRSKGLKSKVITLEDIYDAFNYGVPSPYAVRDFLNHAHARWSGRKVRYAVLAGKGTYDYNDYKGYGDNLVPAILGRTPEGLCAADRIFGDVKGRDGLPEIAMGRLPAVTAAELQAMIDKIKTYEGGQGEWTGKGVFIADNADSGGDFAAGSDELAGLATGLRAEKIYLAGSAAETRAKVIAAWNAGAALVNYCGHGAMSQLATENILNVADARALANGGGLPLAVMLSCAVGRFELPGFTSLGEALVLNAGGGMAGGLLPSGAALNSDSLRLAGEFYKAAYRGKGESAGTALLAAMKKYLQAGGKASLLNVYNWLGDPAAAFK